MKSTHFFLGANSAEGFYSLYDQLLDAGLHDLVILKGGPGCGKSTFMHRMAGALEEHGVETVYIHCSGDPDSLDAVIFPSIRRAVVDGTAPHVLEPRYMAQLRTLTALHIGRPTIFCARLAAWMRNAARPFAQSLTEKSCCAARQASPPGSSRQAAVRQDGRRRYSSAA